MNLNPTEYIFNLSFDLYVTFPQTSHIYYRDVASEMKLLLDAAGRLSPLLPEQQKMELDLARLDDTNDT